MLNTLGRTFIILIAAGLIALGWYAFSTSAASQMMEPPARSAEFSQTDEAISSQMPTGEIGEDGPARPDGGEMGFSLSRVLTGMATNVGITALVIVLLVWLRKLINRLTTHSFEFAWVKK